ncbi:MAG: transglycosylase SLT domain-containing protein [Nitrospiraceae bacterium]
MIQILLRSWNQTNNWIQARAGFLFVVTVMSWMCGGSEIGMNPAGMVVDLEHEAAAPTRIGASHKKPWGRCLREAANVTGVHPALFEAIVKVESGRHPYAFGWYDAGRRWRSYKARTYADAVVHLRALEQQGVRFDVGLAQVNSYNLKVLHQRTGLSSLHALDPCANLHLASLILREQIKLRGRTWKAVAGYNGAVTYVPKVYRAYCLQVPDALHCRSQVQLSHLLSYPLPVLQTDTTPFAVDRKMS